MNEPIINEDASVTSRVADIWLAQRNELSKRSGPTASTDSLSVAAAILVQPHAEVLAAGLLDRAVEVAVEAASEDETV